MRHLTPFLALVACSLIGCGGSHEREGCTGDVPDCLAGWSSSSACCLEGTESAASCEDGAWVCETGSFLPSSCGRVDAVCEGPIELDAGIDAGLRACDAGPIAPCLRGWSGSSDCCLSGDTTDRLCDASGALRCPAGYFPEEACGRIDPMCEGVDAGSPLLYDDCTVTSDCALTTQSCCGTCGQPTRGDVAAVHTERGADYYRDVACPESADGPVDCPACEGQPNPHLTATCDMTGFRPACAVVDFADSPFSDCEGPEDCVLTTPSCCACGEIDASQTIAVNREQAGQINAVTCDELSPVCDPCVAIFDTSLSPVCSAGRCMVVAVDAGG